MTEALKNASYGWSFRPGALGILLIAGAIYYGMTSLDSTKDTTQETRPEVSQIFNVGSGHLSLPDCKTETSDTFLVNGQKYTISCAPK